MTGEIVSSESPDSSPDNLRQRLQAFIDTESLEIVSREVKVATIVGILVRQGQTEEDILANPDLRDDTARIDQGQDWLARLGQLLNADTSPPPPTSTE